MKHPIVIVGGGTGGHLFPAMSLYDALQQQGFPVLLITDQRGQEFYKNISDKPVTLFLRRKPFGRFILDLFHIAFKCLRLFYKMRPDAVVSFGGYTAYMPMAIAQLLRIPTFIHEQNAILGRTHRLNARHAMAIATSFPTVQKLPPRVPVVYCGNPVRPLLLELVDKPYTMPGESITLLVIGGSQGARIFSERIPEALSCLSEHERNRIQVIQQSRPENIEATILAYKKLGIQADLRPFFEDMNSCYRQAHLAITRSGASTVAELAIAGVPAILVPYPYAADAHQQLNAEQLTQSGAAWMFLEKDFLPERIAKILQEALENPSVLQEKASQMRLFAKPDATHRLANFIAGFVRKRHK